MSAFLVIVQFVRFELNYDGFNKDAGFLYRIRNDFYAGQALDHMSAGCPPVLAPKLKENFSEVEDYTRLLRAIRMVISNEAENKSFRSDDVYFADPSVMTLFSYPVVAGQTTDALLKPNQAVITESFAHKSFGNQNPVGKILRFHSRYFDYNCLITSVLKDIPANANTRFDALISMPTYSGGYLAYGSLDSWDQLSMFFTFIRLNKHADPTQLEAKLPAFIASQVNNPEDGLHSKFMFEKLCDIHLNPNKVANYEEATTSRQTVYLLLLIAFVVIVIAWVNYLNLSLAKAIDRSKEVGICKVSGAMKSNLISQFFLESSLFNLFSVVISLTLLWVFRQNIQQLFDKPFNLNFLKTPGDLLIILSLFISGSLISGIYPAFVLSSYNPLSMVKGKLSGNSKTFSIKKGLVVFQFTASIFMIAGVFAVYQQVKYMQQMNLGMNSSQLLVLRAPVMNSDSLFMAKINFLKQEIKLYPELKGMAGSYYVPGKEIRWKGNIQANHNSTNQVRFCLLNGDIDFVPTFGFKILAGRSFCESITTDEEAIVMNETGIKALGFNSANEAVNQTIYDVFEEKPKKIIGVIADYHQLSAKEAYQPTAIMYNKKMMNFYSILINSHDIKASLGKVETMWKSVFPQDPFDYFFLDDYFNQQYKSDIWFTKIFSFFTSIAILIACLGLFGLSNHSIALRTKEIGVRKTLGSTTWAIASLLGKETLQLIVVSTVVALPLFAYFISIWLNNYAFAIRPQWWFYVVPEIILGIIAFGTIGFYVFKTANANPVEALRYE